MIRGMLIILAVLSLHELMLKMVTEVATSGVFLDFVAGMIAFFALRKLAHALEDRL